MTSPRSKTDEGKSLELSVTTPILKCPSPLVVHNRHDSLVRSRSRLSPATLAGPPCSNNSRYARSKNIGANSRGDGNDEAQPSRKARPRSDDRYDKRHDKGHQKTESERSHRGTNDRVAADRAKPFTEEIDSAKSAERVRDRVGQRESLCAKPVVERNGNGDIEDVLKQIESESGP